MRRIIFWTHFVFGLMAGLFILSMSVTGVLLTYERQMVAGARAAAVERPDGAEPMDADALVAAALEAGAAPGNTLTLSSDPGAPVQLSKGRRDQVWLNPYTGEAMEEPGHALEAFFSRVEQIHRWLAFTGKRNETLAAMNAAANLVFGGLLLSGIFLWWPKAWRWPIVKAQLFFRQGLPNAKARHYNWHHVLAVWSLVPLAAIVLSGAVFSYGWANSLVYAAFGEKVPQRGRPPGGAEVAAEAGPAPAEIASYDLLVAQATGDKANWKRVTLTLPAPEDADFAVTVDHGNGVQASKQKVLRLARDGSGPRAEAGAAPASPASKARRFIRFLHTGEIFGVLGQTIAGLASLASVVLVYTGISLAIRRLIRMRKAAQAAAAK
ncbi:MAG: PepSY-associated TM helix domain-containing protein [Hyphomonas sp.]|uniref:PepSY-associated TM helix domain-containing protein n=1 Tax=Hyphomonas sp. TaxID=87 RepID=UPI00352930E7